MYPRTLNDALSELGGIILDDTLAYGTDGAKIGLALAIPQIDLAHRELPGILLQRGIKERMLSREVTLTVDSSDDYLYPLPPRVTAVYRVYDSSMEKQEGYDPVVSDVDVNADGYRVEPGLTAIRFVGTKPDSSVTVYAEVLEEPVRLSAGTVAENEAAASELVLPATPTYGKTILKDDYYNGCYITITAGTGAGTRGRVTDYVASTRKCTMDTAFTVSLSDSIYSIEMDLPRAALLAVYYKAALGICRVVKSLRPNRDRYIVDYNLQLNAALGAFRRPIVSAPTQGRRTTLEWVD